MVEEQQPDVLVGDMRMPGWNGIEVIRRARVKAPLTRIVVLSMYASQIYVSQALKAGAGAYVLKDSSVTDLVCAIKNVLCGNTYLSPGLDIGHSGEFNQIGDFNTFPEKEK